MIAGLVRPDAGRIDREGTVSWPVGFAGSFHGDLTGAEKRAVRREGLRSSIPDALVAYAAAFAELGAEFNAPFRTYSSGHARAAGLRRVDGRADSTPTSSTRSRRWATRGFARRARRCCARGSPPAGPSSCRTRCRCWRGSAICGAGARRRPAEPCSTISNAAIDTRGNRCGFWGCFGKNPFLQEMDFYASRRNQRAEWACSLKP